MTTGTTTRAVVTNLSNTERDTWAIFTVPWHTVDGFGLELTFVADDGRSMRAVKHDRPVGIGTKVTVRVYGYFAAGESITGSILNQPHPDAGPFETHPWVSDDPVALIPFLGARVAGRDTWAEGFEALDMVEQSPAHKRFRMMQRLPDHGLIFVSWFDILSGDPVVPYRGKIVWSDRTDPNPSKLFNFLAIKSGEAFAFDFSRRHGMPERLQIDGKYLQVLNSEPIAFNDGAGLPLSGSILCFRQTAPALGEVDPEEEQRELGNLRAALGGPVLGVCDGWDGVFLANENTPRFSQNYQSEARTSYTAWQQRQQDRAGWFAPRELVSAPDPGRTGDQDDFGATKGTYAVSELDPRHLYRMLYAVQSDLFRGFNHYEIGEDGKAHPLRIEDHPQWVTWSGGTHYNENVSPDRLGKNSSPVPVGTGWLGYDDQHRSQNNLAAYIALSDDPFAEDQVLFHAITDRAAYRVRYPNYGEGAARAQGRTNGTLAALISAVGRETASQLRLSMDARMQPINSNELLNVAGPMKVLAYGQPDNRKPIFLNGVRQRWASLWEHGLAIVGLYGAWKLNRDANTHATLVKVAEFMAAFGMFEHNGSWWTVGDIAYYDGAAPETFGDPESAEFTAEQNTGGVLSWTHAGIIVAREVLGGGHPLRAKLDRYIQATTGYAEATSLRQGEWWAAVASIQPGN